MFSPEARRVFLKRAHWPVIGRLLTDAILINLGFFLAYWVRYQLQWFRPVDESFQVPYRAYIPYSLTLTGILLLIYVAEGLYSSKRKRSYLYDLYIISRGAITSVAALYVLSLVHRTVLLSRLIPAYAGIAVVLLLAVSRAVDNLIQGQMRKRGHGVRRVLIVGAGETGRMIMRNTAAQPELGYHVVGFVDDKPERGNRNLGRFKGLGSTDQIEEIIKEQAVDEVIIALPWLYHRKILGIIGQCERLKVAVRIVPDLFQLSLSQVDIDDLNGIPLIGTKPVSIKGWNLALKRAIDVTISGLSLALFSPLLLIIAVLIRIDSPGPAIFRQTRVGRGGRAFTLYKFRTMREGAEQEQDALQDLNEAQGALFKIREDPRCTALGRFLRRSSLDEFPQLYNVLRGEMSMVGPRPQLVREVEQYEPWHRKRLGTWPGMTGLWQVSGRSDLSFDDMVLLDIYYVENWSLLLDLRIALKTIPTTILGTGAY
jgi:exopolysaccharide biosynthesis polyprenyl glycosylphosphotransferase